MNFAEYGEILRHVPAVIVLTTLNSGRFGHILAPITSLVWLYLLANRLLEVFIAYPAITIGIKIVEKLGKLFF